MKVLFVVTREPGGRRSGRKLVIETVVAALTTLGHDVVVAVLARSSGADASSIARAPIYRFQPPGLWRVLRNVIVGASRGKLSLNECLYFSAKIERGISELARAEKAELVVADMLRAFPAAKATGLPMILDLDDLLSDRYRDLGGQGTNRSGVLGHYGDALPRVLVRPIGWVAGRVVSIEARLIRRREIVAAAQARVVTLVSAIEATRFEVRRGAPVSVAPMAVHVRTGERPPVAVHEPAFVGGLDYRPNQEAVRWFREYVFAELEALGLGGVRLHVYGHCPEDVRRAFSDDRLVLHGYVDDLDGLIQSHALVVAPIRSGTGIKTKVIEAMADRLPVVSTSYGVSGLGVVDGVHAWVADEPPAFARALAEALADPTEAAARGQRGRDLVERDFSFDRICQRWATILVDAMAPISASPIRVLFYNDYPMDTAFEEWRQGLYPGQHLFGVTHLADHGLQARIVPFGRWSALRNRLYGVAGDPHQQLRVFVRQLRGRYDVVYAAGAYNSILLSVARRLRLMRTPLVGTLHHLARGPLRHPVVFRWAYGGHDHLLCMSDDIHQEVVEVLGFAPERVTTVGWAVDLDFYRTAPIPEGDRMVLSAGKTKRDFQTLVNAFRDVPGRLELYCSAVSAPDTSRAGADVTVVFRKDRSNQSEALTFPQLLDRYRRSTVVAIPLPASEVRGTTGLTSLLEAMAMARPVVMTDNSFLDLEKFGVGLRVGPGDVEGWQRALTSLLDDPEEAAQMGRRARTLCEERYSLDRYSARIAAVLTSVANGDTGVSEGEG